MKLLFLIFFFLHKRHPITDSFYKIVNIFKRWGGASEQNNILACIELILLCGKQTINKQYNSGSDRV